MAKRKRATQCLLCWIVLLASVLAAPSWAAGPELVERTAHTFALADGETSTPANLADIAMLVGSWQGEAFGKRFEAVWNPPSNGSMVGMFKLLSDDGVVFYELLLVQQQEDSLVIKVKHFTEDFIAWEEKPDYITFEFLKAEPDAIHFAGLSFYRTGDNEMEGYLVMRGKDDSISEQKLSYQRVGS